RVEPGEGEIVHGEGGRSARLAVDEPDELISRRGPGFAVKEKPVDPRVETFFEGVGELPPPPEREREVRIEVSEDDIAEQAGRVAGEEKADLFAANGFLAFAIDLAVSLDPGARAGHG